VLALPSGFTSTITGIDTPDGPVSEALPMTAATLLLADDIDISRGDMLCRPHNVPDSRQDLDAKICWMDESSVLQPGRKYAIKHTTRWGRALIRDIIYRIDVNTLHRDEEATQLALNEIGRVQLRTTVPFFVDNYTTNRATGSFILVDETTNRTVAAGIIDNH
jgi:bifunctional enzyme CysN/CysC